MVLYFTTTLRKQQAFLEAVMFKISTRNKLRIPNTVAAAAALVLALSVFAGSNDWTFDGFTKGAVNQARQVTQSARASGQGFVSSLFLFR